ncbi:alpha/beta fold hydrolase [Priestia aryabhattai]|uniref:Alpha/beta fold hydrolase n=1 Tax=Priestia aryabhattai TaxID=412384 RepID=A0AAX6ND62_PRIAR|nr:alpha/beta fold hydrolase [Priestia aryabhattai]MDU9693727.1 alpha/beta fold hydrolase [Priestia aryabhattai]
MTEEKIVIGAETNHPLNGILSVPDTSNGLFPAVVLVHGSGPSNMNEEIGMNTPFQDIAEELSNKGIAVLRYDKRTYVYGQEMQNIISLSVKEETIEDAVLASNLLKKDSRIDSSKIFILGHSLGGMLAPRIDAEGGEFAGIIIIGGSPRKLEEIMIDQNNAVLDSLDQSSKVVAEKQISELVSKFDNIYNLSDKEAQSTLIIGEQIRAYYFKEMGENNCEQYLSVLEKPILIIQGSEDYQVSIEKDFNGYKKMLNNKLNATFKLYSNLNHLLMPSVHKGILQVQKDYGVKQHVDKEVIKDITEWILIRNSH